MHLRTTNPIERVFAAVRPRAEKPNGMRTPEACSTMVFKLLELAAKWWKPLHGFTFRAT